MAKHLSHWLWAGLLVAGAGIVGLMVCAPEPVAVAQTALSAAQACASYRAGQNHVLRTFCDGPGRLEITVNGGARTLRGASCETTGTLQAFNVGVIMEPGAAAKPDYVGVTADNGKLIALGVHLNGTGYVFSSKDGTLSNTGGTFTAQGHSIDASSKPVAISAKLICR